MPITTSQARNSIKNIQVEASKLNPSSLVDLFEIDLSNLADERGIILNQNEKVFRFHNITKLVTQSIFWNNKEYVIAPIQAEGFSKTSQGALPTPILRMTVNESGIPLLAILKERIKLFGDLVGAKLTRYRTFAAFLKLANFNQENTPESLSTDEYSEMPPEIWFFNRKTRENKLIIEYELASILDVEGINLPKRQIISKRCNFSYRGEGCLYEYANFKNDDIHGESSILPTFAMPVATEEDKLISEIISATDPNVQITHSTQYINGNTYNLGNSVFIETHGIKYHFVAKRNGISSQPPNSNDWIADKCSKCIKACKLRFDNPNIVITPLIRGYLPFGGFPSIERMGG